MSIPGGESIPDVFDRIADTARRINEAGATTTPETFSTAEPITVTRTSEDGSLTVTVAEGRLTHLGADGQALSERSFADIAKDLVDLANEALDEHDQQHLAELATVHSDFGTLVSSLGHLQADLRAAFTHDMSRLGG